MAAFDLVIRNGQVITPHGTVRADITVRDGVIVEVAPGMQGAGAVELDATNLHVFPGGVDPHVHFQEPGNTAWEGFATIFQGVASPFQEGRYFVGGNSRNYAPVPDAPAMPTLRRGPINNWTDAVAHGAVIALDPQGSPGIRTGPQDR